MPEQKDPKAPVFNPKIKETIAAFKAENSPKNLNDILNDWCARRCWPRLYLTCRASPPPSPARTAVYQLPKDTKISLMMVTSPEASTIIWASVIGMPRMNGRQSRQRLPSRSSCCALMIMPT